MALELIVAWVWQGVTVVLIARGLLAAAGRHWTLSAATRYGVWWVAMTAVLAVPVAGAAAAPAATGGAPAPGRPAIATIDARFRWPAPPPGVDAALLIVWGAGAVAGLCRLGHELAGLRRAKRRAWPMPEARARRLRAWRVAVARGRSVCLGVTLDLPTAAAVGFRSPAVLVPVSLLSTLSDTALDHVLLHEQAHLARRDDWANLLQRVIAVVCWWHPAVWWVNHEIRSEREMAADDWAADRVGSPRRYAESLGAAVAALTGVPGTSLAPGVGAGGAMVRRVARLLDDGRNRRVTAGRGMVGATTVGALVVVGTLASVRPVEFVSGAAAGERPSGLAPPPPPAVYTQVWPMDVSPAILPSPRRAAVARRDWPARPSEGTSAAARPTSPGEAVAARPTSPGEAVAARPTSPGEAVAVGSRSSPAVAGAGRLEPSVGEAGVAGPGPLAPLVDTPVLTSRAAPPRPGPIPAVSLAPATRGDIAPPGLGGGGRTPFPPPAPRTSPGSAFVRLGRSLGSWFAVAGRETADAVADVGTSVADAFR